MVKRGDSRDKMGREKILSYGKYGQAALEAQRLAKRTNNPRQAWKEATRKMFGEVISSQKKGCPREAFLALCEEGKVVGINKGKYTRSINNREYALRAIDLLRNEPEIKDNIAALWRRVLEQSGENKDKCHNQQMNVVLALWLNGLIQ